MTQTDTTDKLHQLVVKNDNKNKFILMVNLLSHRKIILNGNGSWNIIFFVKLILASLSKKWDFEKEIGFLPYI